MIDIQKTSPLDLIQVMYRASNDILGFRKSCTVLTKQLSSQYKSLQAAQSEFAEAHAQYVREFNDLKSPEELTAIFADEDDIFAFLKSIVESQKEKGSDGRNDSNN